MRELNQPAGLTTHEHRVARCPAWREAEEVLGGAQTHEAHPRDPDVESPTREHLATILGWDVEETQAVLEGTGLVDELEETQATLGAFA